MPSTFRTLFRNKVFADNSFGEMSPFWIKWALTPGFPSDTGVEGDKTHRNSMWQWRQRLGLCLKPRECWSRLPVVTKKLRKEARGADPSQAHKEDQPSDTCIVNFWPRELWENELPSLKPSCLWSFVTSAVEMNRPSMKGQAQSRYRLNPWCSMLKAVCPFDLWQLSWQWRLGDTADMDPLVLFNREKETFSL